MHEKAAGANFLTIIREKIMQHKKKIIVNRNSFLWKIKHLKLAPSAKCFTGSLIFLRNYQELGLSKIGESENQN